MSDILQLRSLLKKYIIRDNITLSSGKQSNWYIDVKKISISSIGSNLIDKCFYELLKDVEFDTIGGPETGSIPLSSSLISYLNNNYKPRIIEGFWIRKKPKKYGTNKLIEGCLYYGSKVVILEDVVTTGYTIKKTIDIAEENDCEIVKVLSIVDRDEGGRELLSAYDYNWLFSKEDFE